MAVTVIVDLTVPVAVFVALAVAAAAVVIMAVTITVVIFDCMQVMSSAIYILLAIVQILQYLLCYVIIYFRI